MEHVRRGLEEPQEGSGARARQPPTDEGEGEHGEQATDGEQREPGQDVSATEGVAGRRSGGGDRGQHEGARHPGLCAPRRLPHDLSVGRCGRNRGGTGMDVGARAPTNGARAPEEHRSSSTR